MASIRDNFESDLRAVDQTLLQMCDLADQAVRRATRSLGDCDMALALAVIEGDPQAEAAHRHLEERLLYIIARRSPVATDLRVLLSALRVAADLRRMSGLAEHVAKLVRRRYPRCVAPGDSRDLVLRMGEVAGQLTGLTRQLLQTRDTRLVSRLTATDDRMDRLHRALLTSLLSPDWEHGVEPAVDLTLIARFYERYGDHTVTIAHQVQFIVTGAHPEPKPREVIDPSQPDLVIPR